MRLRISRKLIRHLRAQCFARDSLKLKKRCQLFLRVHNETLPVAQPSNEKRLSHRSSNEAALQLKIY
jgi:hypothetical protein